MKMNTKKDWFTSWFNTPYYHILYKNRDATDAQLFIHNLIAFLQLKNNSHILDIPCGKGRHSLFLNSLGFNVTGKDLSKNNIKFAKQFENNKLHFKVADIRTPFSNTYDAIFNLFTSFGYFEDDLEDIQILKNIKNGLTKNGIAVIDFLNVEKVKKTLVKKEIKTIDAIEFHIHRKIENGFIIKEISFIADNEHHFYFERVKYLDFDKMKAYLTKAGLKLVHTFGNYKLEKFYLQTSNRLILIIK